MASAVMLWLGNNFPLRVENWFIRSITTSINQRYDEYDNLWKSFSIYFFYELLVIISKHH